MAYQSNSVDIASGLVPKSYLLDIYPSLSNVVTTPSLWCWGGNSAGQLGDNTTVKKSSPVQTIAGGTNWNQVTVSSMWTCAGIKTDGTLWMWGYNSAGQLGDNTRTDKSSPVQSIAGGTNWKQVACGDQLTAAIKTDGTLWAWGGNTYGQLGDNSTTSKSSPVQTFAGGTNWKQLSCGVNFLAAVKTDGTLWVWGHNGNGQLCTGNSTPVSSPVQVLGGGTTWKQTSAGNVHLLAIKNDGTLWSGGYGGYGQLGRNSSTSTNTLTQVDVDTTWKLVKAGVNHSSGIKTDGTLWMWGLNDYGQLGDNTTISRSSPIQTVAGGTNWRYVNCGYNITAAIKSDGSMWLCGYNSSGQIGDLTTAHKSSPVQTIAGGTNWKQVHANRFTTIAIADNDALGDARNPITSVTISGSSAVTTGNSYVYTALINYLAGPSSTDCTKLSWSTGSSSSTGSSTVTNVAANGVTVSIDGDGTDIITASDYSSSYNTTLSLSSGSFYGTLWTWGNNANGQLGDSTTVSKSSPVQTIAGGTNWKQVVCGLELNAAIKTDGTLWCWGYNQFGQLGDNTTVSKSSPVQTIVGGTNWKLVACGQRSSAAIKTDGTLWTWGENEYGQLGDNTTTHKSSPVQTVAGGTNWKQVSCGSAYTAAIKSDGTLWMCGYNNLGQLGDNTITKKSSPVQTVAGGTNWKQVACGRWHTAAIKSDGTLWGWGRNNGGPLGDNTITTKSSPVQTIAGGTNWKHVSCGGEHTVAVKTDGTLWGWGYCGYGQLGDNTTANKSSPVQTITGGTSWRWVAAGLYHTAAIKTDGTMWLWGYNTNGQLGDNTTTRKSSPVQTIIGGTNWKMVAAGMYNTTAIQESSTPYVTNVAIAGTTSTTMLSSYTYTATMTYNNGTTSTDCTLLNWSAGGGTGSSTITGVTSSNVTVSMDLDGTDSLTASTTTGVTKTLSLTTSGFSATLWGWGYNGQGQLGDNTRTSQLSPVQTIAGGTNWKQVSGGSQFTAAVKSDGTLWTWGYNAQGGLGTNNTTRVSSPVQTVAGGTNWKQVSCGLYHMSAIKTNGTLWSCGYNHKGQLGDNTITKKSSPVQTVAGGTNWKQVSGGQYHTAAIKTDGTLWTWGYNPHGALGNNTFNDTSSPAQTITGGTNWKQVSCGYSHTAAIKTDGTLWMIGNNTTGQLGDGTIVRKPSPVQTVSGGTNWRQVATGYQHTAAIKTDGTVWAWGDGSLGSLGDNTSVRKSSPVQTISGGTNWKQVSCFNFQTAGIKSDGTLWTWGYNNYGQLGDNTSVNKSSPVQTAAGGINWKYVACGYINTYGLS